MTAKKASAKKAPAKKKAPAGAVDVSAMDASNVVIKDNSFVEGPVEALIEIEGEPGLEGHFVDVVSGEHDGRCGTFAKVLETHKDGSPKTILIRTRDANDELLPVAYKDVRHTTYKGGR